ncbi:A/G-specific adenine glycosylase [Marinospirillum alkaliphilum]|uniref:Adenine DNA glycosylase n=1 Tax=Marinospirillum alkaliphilum DSM 21637 TaxID=1122209 RepID=A0A1K1Z8A9_9GAMM|nr:A/G-specific adenine glycosylase [Marinospirillum alkaliphilum]SFX70296.1 A/G-specific DNA-adenine glycosylase [Marinospirillum alkaliphilum DSM 21637]
MKVTCFSDSLLDWYQHQGRKHLPWQQTQDPYRIWVSEIMLQQTQVTTVLGYYQRFMTRFPDLASLAAASLDEVLHHWAGLGYYSRARNLHRCAQQVVAEHQGAFPVHDQQLMEALPGIGPSTAAAIRAFSTGARAVILDGNVKRVVARYFAIEGWPGQSAITRLLWQKADQLTPDTRLAEYTQAIMDLGATCCTPRNPQCGSCPVQEHCQAHLQGRTDQLPTAKPGKKLPEHTRHALLLTNPAQHLLLEQRPANGIWGGLWSLPEFDEASQLQQWLEQQYPGSSLTGDVHQQLHTFSHYRLQLMIHSHQLNTDAANPGEPRAEPGYHSRPLNWYDPDTRSSIGLAAPVSRLLQARSKTS